MSGWAGSVKDSEIGPRSGPAFKALPVWDGLGTGMERCAGCCEREGLTEWRGKHEPLC